MIVGKCSSFGGRGFCSREQGFSKLAYVMATDIHVRLYFHLISSIHQMFGGTHLSISLSICHRLSILVTYVYIYMYIYIYVYIIFVLTHFCMLYVAEKKHS